MENVLISEIFLEGIPNAVNDTKQKKITVIYSTQGESFQKFWSRELLLISGVDFMELQRD